MYCHLLFAEDHIRYKMAELQREAEHDRLVQLASAQRLSVRRRMADWLVSVAERIDDQPRGQLARAEA